MVHSSTLFRELGLLFQMKLFVKKFLGLIWIEKPCPPKKPSAKLWHDYFLKGPKFLPLMFRDCDESVEYLSLFLEQKKDLKLVSLSSGYDVCVGLFSTPKQSKYAKNEKRLT